MPKSYRAGTRRSDLDREGPRLDGKMSTARWAWLRVNFGQLVIFFKESPTRGEEDADVMLTHPRPGRGAPVQFNLTGLTEEELLAFKDFVDTAIDWALPIVRTRDKEAKDAFDNGDDSDIRVYRQVPQLVYRKRPKREHSEGLRDGSEDVFSVDRDYESRDEELRIARGEVAQRNTQDGSTKDNWPTPHVPPNFR